MNKIEWVREQTFPGRILLIDGMTGAGKNMISRVIDGYPNNHNPIFSYELEQLCIAWSQKKIDLDANIALIRMHIDKIRYNFSVSRELNFRPSDLTSIFRSKKRNIYIKNLLKNREITNLKDKEFFSKNLCIITHQLLGASQVMDLAFPQRVLRIFTIRHPIYLYQHWLNYIPKHGTDPKDITVWNDHKGVPIPWFAKDYGELYSNASYPDKAAIVLSDMVNKSIDYIESKQSDEKFQVIDFENFVIHPHVYLTRINSLLGENFPHKNKKILTKENIPRNHINSARNLSIYRRSNYGTFVSKNSHKEDYEERLTFISKRLSDDCKLRFLQSVERYNDKFGIWF